MFIRAIAVTALLSLCVEQSAVDTAADWLNASPYEYTVHSNTVYGRASGQDLTVDIYTNDTAPERTPTLVYFHGGGWIVGSKEAAVLNVLPYLRLGWHVVNVRYRLGPDALAPAAIEDARCALRWVVTRGADYGIGSSSIVLSGRSAGGHLALMAAVLTSADGFDYRCDTLRPARADAVVLWFPLLDVRDLATGANGRTFARAWLGHYDPERVDTLSPLTYVDDGNRVIPPVVTVHGDADTVVPIAQSMRLHDTLAKREVFHRLVRVPGGKHADFDRGQLRDAFAAIESFLSDTDLQKRASRPQGGLPQCQ